MSFSLLEAKVTGESSREQKFHLWNFRSWEAKVRANESSIIRYVRSSGRWQPEFIAYCCR